MKKLMILVVLLAVLGGGVYYLFLSLNSIVKAAIETTGTEATKTSVGVSNVDIELTNGKGAIKGFTIANPPAFKEPLAFSLGGIALKVDTSSVTKNPVVIDEIIVKAPEVVFEVNKDGKANLGVLKENLLKMGGGGGSAPQDEKQESTTRLVIRKFVVEAGKMTARIAALGDKPLEAKLDRFVLTNIGDTSKGSSPDEVARKLIGEFINRASKAATRQGLDKHIKGKVNELKNKVENKITNRLQDKLGVSKEEGKKALKGLFGR